MIESVRFFIRFSMFFLSLVLFAAPASLPAQVTGGESVYAFLDLPASARMAALRGNLLSVADGDVVLAEANPALLRSVEKGALSFSHAFLPAGIQTGYFAYAHRFEKAGLNAHLGLRYIAYGSFQGRDETGAATEMFKAKETALIVGASRQLYERLSLGVNVKVVSSAFEQYNSWGLLGDLGFFYSDTSRNLHLGLVFRQFGRQLTTYADLRERPPYDLRLAVSKRLKYLPFRLTVMYHDLQDWNILYDDPTRKEDQLLLFDESVPQEDKGFAWFDNLARHFTLSGEFLLGKRESLRLRLGYDHQLQREMKVRTYRSLAGFSLGFGLQVKRFRIDYGYAFQHLAGGYHYFTLSTGLRQFGHKKALD